MRSGASGIRAQSWSTAPTPRSRSSIPWPGIRAGVLRTIDERPGWRPHEALTVEQALIASTVTPAWVAGDERRRGRLLPGFLADLVVLSRPFHLPHRRAESVGIVATMVRRTMGLPTAALGLSDGTGTLSPKRRL